VSRIVYVNGSYRRYADAYVHVEDRGFQFADAVYEVIEVFDHRLVDTTRHLARLDRSLAELKIRKPVSDMVLRQILNRIIRLNRVKDGIVYVQVTRGEGPRNFEFPPPAIVPTLVVIARAQPQARIAAQAARGIAVKSMPDLRWARCDIKTVMLLPACLAKNAALSSGAKEAWFVDDEGNVTEGASSNAWIVTDNGKLVTRKLDQGILPGITRATLIDCARAEGLTIEERAFSVAEAMRAREAFVTSASNTVMPVVEVDGTKIADGKPGEVTLRLRSIFHHSAEFSVP
jgi:D-alanine transaminase